MLDQDIKLFKQFITDFENGKNVIMEAVPVVKRILESNEVTFNAENMKKHSLELLRECLKKIECKSLILEAPYAEAIYQDKMNEVYLNESIKDNGFMVLEDNSMVYGFVRFKGEKVAIS